MAKNAQDLQLRELKDLILDLRKTIQVLQANTEQLMKKNAELEELLKNKQEAIDYLTRKLFGTSSEKRDKNPDQIGLFNEVEAEAAAITDQEEEITEEVKIRNKRKTNEERFKGIPREKVYLNLPEDQKVCEVCGTELEKIGEELVRREIDYVPAKVKVIEYYSVNYVCPNCKENEEKPNIRKGSEGKSHALYGMVTARTLAWVMYQKYANALPLYRQEKDWQQYGLDITRATLANWIILNTEAFLKPFYEYLHRQLLQCRYVMADETPVQVLHEKDRPAERKSYMWTFLSGEYEPQPIRLYKYSQTRAGETAADFLEDYDGYIMCDGYSGYNKLVKAKRTTCFAHIRRYIWEAIPKGQENDYSLPAVQGFAYVNRLFALEKDIQAKNSGKFEAVRKARIQKEKPVLDAFLAWAGSQAPVPGSRFAKAITYILNRKDEIPTYLEDSHCSFSNNASERVVKDFVIGRKNWLFSDTPAGAESSSIIYSLVATAKANGVNVYHYLSYLLEKLPASDLSDEALAFFVPWDPKVKAEVESRSKR